ncbi:hypothetical protein PGB90_001859 [Kerria lacca]
MFYWKTLTALLVIQYHVYSYSYGNNIDVEKIVNFVNNNPKSTWKADTYGMKTMPIDFVRQRINVNRKYNGKHFLQQKGSIENHSYQYGESIPTTFSWLTTNKTTCKMDRIGDQSNCFSDTIFALVGSFTDRLCLKTNGSMNEHLSVEYVLSCNPDISGCSGSWDYNILKFLKLNGTITGGYYDSDEGCQPYSVRPCGGFLDRMPCSSNISYTPKCKKKECTNDWHVYRTENLTYKLQNWYRIYAYYNDFYAKRDLYNNGPIMTTFSVYDDFLFYKKGIYERTYSSKFLGLQDVKIVGYGTENGTSYWQAANSWGTSWGDNGFFKIKHGTCSFGYYVVAVEPNITAT